MTSDAVIKGGKDKNNSFDLQAELCQSLTHPFRLKIIHFLEDGEKNVSEIITETDKPQPYISQHLRVLKDKGIVKTRRSDNKIFYSLTDPKILDLCNLVAGLVAKRQGHFK